MQILRAVSEPLFKDCFGILESIWTPFGTFFGIQKALKNGDVLPMCPYLHLGEANVKKYDTGMIQVWWNARWQFAIALQQAMAFCKQNM